eukprot:TRINITY_DN20219_c0_g1_i1.p1 TRINITY_DN20219_c0_g1~~TRINITY_DN20219_c0_g1_i1.p1  ORF type:complete len:152 (-),score=17.59 TRINITY_DN20219_c0_g1_i1:357-812(-)
MDGESIQGQLETHQDSLKEIQLVLNSNNSTYYSIPVANPMVNNAFSRLSSNVLRYWQLAQKRLMQTRSHLAVLRNIQSRGTSSTRALDQTNLRSAWDHCVSLVETFKGVIGALVQISSSQTLLHSYARSCDFDSEEFVSHFFFIILDLNFR